MIDRSLLTGISIGMVMQLLSVVSIWSILNFQKSDLYVPTSWLIIGLSSAAFIYSAINYGLVTSTGFVIPYAVILPIPFLITCLVGQDTATLLIVDGIKLLIFLASTLLIDRII